MSDVCPWMNDVEEEDTPSNEPPPQYETTNGIKTFKRGSIGQILKWLFFDSEDGKKNK